jgi:hypothetical protein
LEYFLSQISDSIHLLHYLTPDSIASREPQLFNDEDDDLEDEELVKVCTSRNPLKQFRWIISFTTHSSYSRR